MRCCCNLLCGVNQDLVSRRAVGDQQEVEQEGADAPPRAEQQEQQRKKRVTKQRDSDPVDALPIYDISEFNVGVTLAASDQAHVMSGECVSQACTGRKRSLAWQALGCAWQDSDWLQLHAGSWACRAW